MANHKLNGDFEVHFKRYEVNNLTIEQVETGRWSYDKGVLYTEAHKISDILYGGEKNVYYFEAYDIVHLDANSFTYKNRRTGNEYTKKKVYDGFEF